MPFKIPYTHESIFVVLAFLTALLLPFDKLFPLFSMDAFKAHHLGAFGVLLLRTSSIYPIGLLHGVINFSSSFDKLPGAEEPENIESFRIVEAGISFLVVLPFLLFALYQLNKIDKNVILRKFDKTIEQI